MSPKVSVIVPVYNASEYLGECLDSILLQTLSDIEVICIDDGSTDDSLGILQSYAMFDERLKIISQKNMGAGAARNNGLKQATGEYIICLDSDDFFELDMLEKMVQKAEEDNSDVVVCGYYIYDNKTQQYIHIVLPQLNNTLESPFKPEECPEQLFTFISPNAWTKLFKTNYIKKENILFDNTSSSNDVLFVCTALTLAKKISVMQQAFIHYRINTTTQISYNKTKDIIPLLTTLKNLYNILKSKRITNFQNYFNRLHASLRYELGNRSKNNKRISLMSIRKILPDEIIQKMFFSSDKPAVSIIVPVYNAEKFLPECLDSCINQTLKNIEIICVDDGSTDNSLEILNNYAKKDYRIKVLTQPNQRQGIARNTALKIATGEYIQYLDSDDYLQPESCECLYLYAKIFDLEMLFFTARDFQDETNKTSNIPYHQLQWLPDNFVSVFSWQNVKEVMHLVAVTACLTFYKHDFLKKHNIHWINKKICYEDSPYFIESFFNAQRVGALKEDFYQRRLHGNNTTTCMDSNFPDYCKISYLTLKIAKQYADDITFTKLFYGYTLKTYHIYRDLPTKSREKFKKTLFALYEILTSFYNLSLLDEALEWYQENSFLITDPSRCTVLFQEMDDETEIAKFYEKKMQNNLNIIPIILASDKNYAPFMQIAILSILKNGSQNTFYDFYLMVSDDFTSENKRLINELKKEYKCNIQFLDMKDTFKNIPSQISHITTPTYYRLLAASLLPKEYSKCLYLDTDVLVCKDLQELYNTDLSDAYFAGVPAIAYHLDAEIHKKRLNLPDINTYINAGVLVMNLELIRENDFENKFLSLLEKRYSGMDQDIINVACHKKIKLLDFKYNVMTKCENNLEILKPFFEKEKLDNSINYPVIIHYCDKKKPWTNPHSLYAERWWECARNSPYYEKILYDFLFPQAIKTNTTS